MGVLIACPPSYDCRAILWRLVRVVMGSGLDRVRSLPRLLRIPCGFVSFRPFPTPSPRAASSRVHPIPSRFVPSYPPNPLDYFAPIALIAITPRLSCRRNGADFINASNSMPLKSGLRNDASLLLAYRHAGSICRPSAHLILSSRCAPFLACRSYPIPSCGWPANGAAATITPRQSPRPSCRGTGRRMCLDVIGCHMVDTVIYDSRVGIRPIEPVRYFQSSHSSHHLIPFLSSPCPPLPGSLLPAYLI